MRGLRGLRERSASRRRRVEFAGDAIPGSRRRAFPRRRTRHAVARARPDRRVHEARLFQPDREAPRNDGFDVDGVDVRRALLLVVEVDAVGEAPAAGVAAAARVPARLPDRDGEEEEDREGEADHFDARGGPVARIVRGLSASSPRRRRDPISKEDPRRRGGAVRCPPRTIRVVAAAAPRPRLQGRSASSPRRRAMPSADYLRRRRGGTTTPSRWHVRVVAAAAARPRLQGKSVAAPREVRAGQT